MAAALARLDGLADGGVDVEVMAGNDAAVRLYETFGFRARTVRLRHVPADPRDP